MSMIDHNFVPGNEVELAECLADPMWRVCSGQLYKIMTKDDALADGTSVMPFRPNRAQRRFIRRLWFRNIILKARQLGFTTLISILWLDHALFNENQRCGIVAHEKDVATEIFRDKVRFAYDNLPDALREAMPLKQASATTLLFAHNNSSIKVAISVRGGTIHRLHISEFGKICAKYPAKAKEVLTGSLPAVPKDGIAIIESTAEGQGGAFHDMTIKAEERSQIDRPLTIREWRFNFEPWWKNEDYEMDPEGVIITSKEHDYFDTVEAQARTVLSLRQRAWYIATRESDFSGDPEKMWQEYPSTSKEAFQASTEGKYYTVQLAAARKSGRIGKVPHVSHVPVHTFWDIGHRDGTAIWLMQKVGLEYRFIGYIEAHEEPFEYFVNELEKLGYIWGTHHLPHDATHKRQQGKRSVSPQEMLEEMRPHWRFDIVPRIEEVTTGIQLVRSMLSQCWFDETMCSLGLQRLANYGKERDPRLNVWKPTPLHDENSEGADAFRQFAQGWSDPITPAGSRPSRKKRPSAMAA
ncbi:hypothetical protein [Sphingobium cupriresistens]|uniref:hypothetical protein n=1 Tax=Sphingobium cupriresistens TaxID=1132417 RepID=UPI003BAE0A0B